MLRHALRRLPVWPASLLFFPIAVAGCGKDDAMDVAIVDANACGDPGAIQQLREAALDVSLEYLGNQSGSGTAGSSILRITTHDGITPIRTDLWLYTLVGGQLHELDAFAAAIDRRSRRLLLPATLGGVASGLVPADDGRQNGLMTDGARGSLIQGAFVSAIDGTVLVTLPKPPTDPVMVVAGVEDQRYAGAAVLLPDGTAGTVPPGVGAPETHARVSYACDVAPILSAACTTRCHNPAGPFDASRYRLDTQDHIVNDNFAIAEKTEDCKAMYPDDPVRRARCIRDITAAEFLVEPGAPALSELLLRTRPDEALGTSALGLGWYGSDSKARYDSDYGDRRMPSTTISTNMADWTNAPTYFDMNPKDFQVLYDWVAQGALP